MKLNRKLVLFLSLVLSLALATGGTLAYLSDTDADVNTMTLGNVKIEQHEYERVVDADGEFTTINSDKYGEGYMVQEFTQHKPLYPAVGTLTDYDTTGVYWDQLGEGASGGQMVLDGLENVVDKFVLVENTGKSDAYVRTLIAYELGSIPAEDFEKVVMTVRGDFFTPTDIGVIQIKGNNYFLIEYLYVGNDSRHPGGVLPAGEYTYNSLAQLYMLSDATNEDVEAIDGNKNGTYDVLVVSQAIQTAGFADAKTALDTGFGKVTTTSHPWVDIDNPESEDDQEPDGEIEWPDAPAQVATADELVAALEAGKDVVLTKNIKIDPASMSNSYGATGINIKEGQTIDGNGYTIDIQGAGGTWDSGINTTGGKIKNVTITGSFRGIFINHNSEHSEKVVLENVTTTNTTYTISCDQGLNQDLLATNCTFNGWTSYAGTLGNAKFVNCNFNEGNGYAYCRPYAPTEFVGCDFQEGFTVDPRAAVTFENCTIGGVALTADNLDTLVTSTANVTLK